MLPEEEYHSLKETYKFLCDIIDPKKTPAIPKSMRDNAKKCLEHYPVRRRLIELDQGVEFFNPR
jgi:hypothetical protein